MCLVSYSDLLPRAFHDDVMKVVESPVGQEAKELADALFRATMADGRNALTALHQEGFIKKVPTNQVTVTPTPTAKIRLDELNKLLAEMEAGDDAVKRLQELDNAAGMNSKKHAPVSDVEAAKRPKEGKTATSNTTDAVNIGALSDSDLAKSRLNQAAVMRRDAEQLLTEAARLEKEANSFVTVTKPTKNVRTAKKAPAKTSKVKTS